jgi:hypothetical protein
MSASGLLIADVVNALLPLGLHFAAMPERILHLSAIVMVVMPHVCGGR